MRAIFFQIPIIFFFLTSISSFTQVTWEWAKAAGGSSSVVGHFVCTDNNNDIFVAGAFYGSTMSIGSTTINSMGDVDIYLAKYSSNGSFLWVKSGGGIGWEAVRGVVADGNGNVYITGHYDSPSISFGSTTLSNTSNTSGITADDMFLVKYGPNGNLIWAKNYGGTLSEAGFDIVVDQQGQIHITGGFRSSSLSFDGITLYNSSQDEQDFFVVKFDVNGNALWAKASGGPEYDSSNSLKVDNDGNVYVGGVFSSISISLGSITLNNPYVPGQLFYVKYNSSGSVLWAKSAGGDHVERCKDIVLDPSGNLYVSGHFYGTSMDFDNITLNNMSSDNTSDIFLAKYDPNGNVVWAKRTGGAASEEIRGMVSANNGDIFMTGYHVSPSWTIGSTTLTNNSTFGNIDMFVAKVNSSGTMLWGESIQQGNDFDEVANDIAIDGNGSLYITGSVNAPSIDFGTNTIYTQGGIDMFVAKFYEFPAGIYDDEHSQYRVTAYPNPATDQINFETNDPSAQSIDIYDQQGKLLERITMMQSLGTTIFTDRFSKGAYFFSVKNDIGKVLYSGKFHVIGS